jgi:hypothetical protein
MSKELVTSPLGLYYIGGVVVHSDDGPQAAVRWIELNESHAFVDTVGAIQPDSSVIFRSDRPEHPVLYFDVKTRKLQLESDCFGLVRGMMELFTEPRWQAYYYQNNIGSDRVAAPCETKLDAYMAAFEALQG